MIKITQTTTHHGMHNARHAFVMEVLRQKHNLLLQPLAHRRRLGQRARIASCNICVSNMHRTCAHSPGPASPRGTRSRCPAAAPPPQTAPPRAPRGPTRWPRVSAPSRHVRTPDLIVLRRGDRARNGSPQRLLHLVRRVCAAPPPAAIGITAPVVLMAVCV